MTITTGGPLPIETLGMFAAVHPPPWVLPPLLPNNHTMPRKPSMPMTTTRILSLRKRFLSAGGMPMEVWLRAAYGGGREVFRGGIAKCIVCGVEVRGQGGWPL